jgi:TonB family protein
MDAVCCYINNDNNDRVMREMINYIVEVNIALLLLLAFYKIVLQHENQFRVQRIFLLVAIMFSLTLPLLHFAPFEDASTLSIGKVVPEYWLPEITVGQAPEHAVTPVVNTAQGMWNVVGWIYLGGVIIFSLWLVMQVGYVWIMVRNHTAYRLNRLRIIESVEDKPSFSFFNLIYIGKADHLTAMEKEQIIRHESEHARQLHSIDIMIVALLGIVFWFNPFIHWYKKIFIQLHEFEADARAVENTDVNVYCGLLARVALQAHLPIANHFNESLTVKRIEMMRTQKKKIKTWKLAAMAITFITAFAFVACQDQLTEEIANSTITQTGDFPPEIQAHMDRYKAEHPQAKLTYFEGAPEEMEKFAESPDVKSRVIYYYVLKKNAAGDAKHGLLLTDVVQHAEKLATSDKVFMVVEQMPEYPGGYEAMKQFVKNNLQYPKAADQEGTVYVSMVINETGAVTDVKVLRGVHALLDAEALRVVKMLPTWKPGMQNGKVVKTRYNLPIRFSKSDADHQHDGVAGISTANYKMSAGFKKTNDQGKAVLKGDVVSESGKALAGVNVHIAGTSVGTTTDSQGRFALAVPSGDRGKLVFSFVGFDTVEKEF